MRMTIQDPRTLGICLSGVKSICEVEGIDFRKFVREGIDIADVEHIDDDNMRAAIAQAKKRIAEEAENE